MAWWNYGLMISWSDDIMARWNYGPMISWSDDIMARWNYGPMISWLDDIVIWWNRSLMKLWPYIMTWWNYGWMHIKVQFLSSNFVQQTETAQHFLILINLIYDLKWPLVSMNWRQNNRDKYLKSPEVVLIKSNSICKQIYCVAVQTTICQRIPFNWKWIEYSMTMFDWKVFS